MDVFLLIGSTVPCYVFQSKMPLVSAHLHLPFSKTKYPDGERDGIIETLVLTAKETESDPKLKRMRR